MADQLNLRRRSFHMRLELPANIVNNIQADELMTVWLINQSATIVIKPGVFRDHAVWGILLSDLVEHIANSVTARSFDKREQVIERILSGFRAEREKIDSDNKKR